MTIRLTEKARIKLRINKLDDPQEDYSKSFLNEWFVSLFTVDRKSYFIITEKITLYTLVFHAAGINSKDTFFKAMFEKLIGEIPLELDFYTKMNDLFTTVSYQKTNNRSVLGSQRELMFMSKYEFWYGDPPDLNKINDTPMGKLDYSSPIEEFFKKLKE